MCHSNEHILGFMDDYTKVTYGMRDTLQLIRKGDDDSLFRTVAAGVEKVVLTKLAWSVPIVQPNDVRKVNLYKSIVSNNVIPVSFRMRQCNLTNMRVVLNHSRYPSVDMPTDFVMEKYAGVYKSFYDFSSRYYGIDNLLDGSAVNPITFKSFYPIHVFYVSKQSERLKEGVVDLTVRMEFSVAVPANIQAYALVISDRMLKFKSDGSKMSVLF